MFASLASRKLEVAIQQSFDELLEESPRAAMMAALLSWAVSSKSWPPNFATLAKHHAGAPVVYDFILNISYHSYVHEKMSAEQRADAERYFRTILSEGNHNYGKFIERLRIERARATASDRALGQN
jgi:AraC-like DNA-binding protein